MESLSNSGWKGLIRIIKFSSLAPRRILQDLAGFMWLNLGESCHDFNFHLKEVLFLNKIVIMYVFV